MTMASPFVDHLRSTGLLSQEQAERVQIWASGRHDPIGIIAVEHGLLIGTQIEELLAHQRDGDWLFGELAVKLGYLTRPSLDQLLEIQRQRQWARVAEAVALSGILPTRQVFCAYARFVLEHSPGDAARFSAAA